MGLAQKGKQRFSMRMADLAAFSLGKRYGVNGYSSLFIERVAWSDSFCAGERIYFLRNTAYDLYDKIRISGLISSVS